MFQEQYVRVLEYKLELIPSILIENGAAYTSYKMHQGQRLGERVVRADRERGKVSCDCKWWGTMRLLCRHTLTVMHLLGMFGCAPFQDLPKEYIKDRWTGEARDAYDDLIIQRPLTRVEEDDEWFVRSSAEFGEIVRKAVRCDKLRPIVDMKAKELADMLKQTLLIVDAHPSEGGAPNVAADQRNRGKGIATKNPIVPKPSKNTPRFKAVSEISRMKQRKKYKDIHAKEVAAEHAARQRDLADQLAAPLGGEDRPRDCSIFFNIQYGILEVSAEHTCEVTVTPPLRLVNMP
ncbi:hypothetical protein LINPERPRIM_LOCUS5325 [Linum perenne]